MLIGWRRALGWEIQAGCKRVREQGSTGAALTWLTTGRPRFEWIEWPRCSRKKVELGKKIIQGHGTIVPYHTFVWWLWALLQTPKA